MLRSFVPFALLTLFLAHDVVGQEHRVEAIKRTPEAKGLSKEVAATLSDEGIKVIRGTSRTVCEFWPCKKWEISANFKPTTERLYPFKAGHLIGLLHFPRRGKDFRDQTIKSGWYTLRYALQPTDGNHEGTSSTRDFLVMVRAEEDKSPETIETKQLLAASAEAANSAHPAMLCFQRPPEASSKDSSLRHVEDNDWWVLHFTGTGVADGTPKDLSADLIVVGHADE